MNKIFNYLYELLQQFFPGNVIENVKNIKLFYYKKLTMDKQLESLERIKSIIHPKSLSRDAHANRRINMENCWPVVKEI